MMLLLHHGLPLLGFENYHSEVILFLTQRKISQIVEEGIYEEFEIDVAVVNGIS